MPERPTLLSWTSEYFEDGDGDDAHIERLTDAIRALEHNCPASTIRMALAAVRESRKGKAVGQ